VYVKRKQPSNTTKIIYYWLHNTIICYTMQLVSTQQWGHHQAKNKKLETLYVHESALRDPVRFTLVSISIAMYIYLYIK
jgi:hypothetical protein